MTMTNSVLSDVARERERQEEKYGHVNDLLPWGSGPNTRWLLMWTGDHATEIERKCRLEYEDYEEEAGLPTWLHLVREEVAEAFQERDPLKLQQELIQVAALCVSWVERIRKNTEWGVWDDRKEVVVSDPGWKSPADVLKSAHGFGHGPYRLFWREPEHEWTELQ